MELVLLYILLLLLASSNSLEAIGFIKTSHFAIETVNDSLPILQTLKYDGNHLTCISLCLDMETCYATNVQATDSTCNIFGDKRYLKFGTYQMKLVEGNISIRQRTCQDPFQLVSNRCLYMNSMLTEWGSAKTVCESMHRNGRLAEFHSEVDIVSLTNLGTQGAFWVGGKRNQSTITSIWETTGKNISSELMMNPNQPHLPGNGDGCYLLALPQGKLLFFNCYVILPFLCETV